MIMPFGKYKGHDLTSIPSYYLRWLAENIDEQRNKDVCLAADKEWQFRELHNCHVE